MRAPSELGITTGTPPSRTATQELVVPRSIPIVFAIVSSGRVVRGGCLFPGRRRFGGQALPLSVPRPLPAPGSASGLGPTLTRVGRKTRSCSLYPCLQDGDDVGRALALFAVDRLVQGGVERLSQDRSPPGRSAPGCPAAGSGSWPPRRARSGAGTGRGGAPGAVEAIQDGSRAHGRRWPASPAPRARTASGAGSWPGRPGPAASGRGSPGPWSPRRAPAGARRPAGAPAPGLRPPAVALLRACAACGEPLAGLPSGFASTSDSGSAFTGALLSGPDGARVMAGWGRDWRADLVQQLGHDAGDVAYRRMAMP